ncbi:MAG: hypothetical protein NVSMB5_03810 [Candidatus Velthaea sp.]
MTFASFVKRVAQLPPRTKTIAACVALAIFTGIALAFGMARDTRAALFATPLKPDQLAEVEQRLAAWNIAYVPLPDNVRVAGTKRSELLLRLAVAGAPHAHLSTSEEMLARVGALTPQAVLEAQTRDGLAGDLALGLRGLDGVADARVIVAPARTGMYADETSHDASASVRISLMPGAHLLPRTVAGIKAFVSGGVPGLDAERVTVLDDRGLVLEGDGNVRVEDGVQSALQSALDAAFGAGGAIVRVHRDVLAEKRDVYDVRRTPLAGAIARSSSDERYASDRKKYSKANTVEDRGSDTHEERRSTAPGATERLSVAIFVDAARTLDLVKIRSLAEATAGIDRRRGDTLSVEAVRFAARAPDTHASSVGVLLGSLAGMIPQIIFASAIALGMFFGAKPAYALAVRAVERASIRATARDVAGIPPTRVRGALAGEPAHIAAAIISALPAATATAVLELYPAEERAAIVRRLARPASPLIPSAEDLIRVRG